MQQSHAQQIQILLGFIGVLILVIFVPLILSVIRSQKKNKTVIVESKETEKSLEQKPLENKPATIQDRYPDYTAHLFQFISFTL